MGGLTLSSVLLSRGFDLIQRSFMHHVPTLIAVEIISIVGDKYCASMHILTVSFVLFVYSVIFILDTNLDEARNEGWFWEAQDFNAKTNYKNFTKHSQWFPPLPFGVLIGLLYWKVYFPAVIKVFPTAIAIATIYLRKFHINRSHHFSAG